MSLTAEQRSRLRVLAEEYAQAIGALRVAEREVLLKRHAYAEYVAELGPEVVVAERAKEATS